MKIKKKANHFVHHLSQKIKDGSCIKSKVKATKNLRKFLKKVVANVNHEKLKLELSENFEEYLVHFRRDVTSGDELSDNGARPSNDAMMTEMQSMKPPATACPYNLCSRQNQITLDLNTLPEEPSDEQLRLLRLYLSRRIGDKSFNQQPEILRRCTKASTRSWKKNTDWIKEFDLLLSSAISLSDHDITIKIMSLFCRKICEATEYAVKKKKFDRLKELKNHTIRLVHVFYMSTERSRQDTVYEDSLSSILSAYVDQNVVLMRNCGKTEVKETSRHLCCVLGYLLQSNQTYVIDVFIQASEVTAEDERLILPILRKYLNSVSVINQKIYTKYMYVVKQYSQLFGDSVKDLVQKAGIIPAPDGYINWLMREDRTIVDEMPVTPLFKGLQITRFLLDEAETDMMESLLDLLTDVVPHTGEKSDHSDSQSSQLDTTKDSTMENENKHLFFIDKSVDGPLVHLPEGDLLEHHTEEDTHKVKRRKLTEENNSEDEGNDVSQHKDQMDSSRRDLLTETENVLLSLRQQTEDKDRSEGQVSDGQDEESDLSDDGSSGSSNSESSDEDESEYSDTEVSKFDEQKHVDVPKHKDQMVSSRRDLLVETENVLLSMRQKTEDKNRSEGQVSDGQDEESSWSDDRPGSSSSESSDEDEYPDREADKQVGCLSPELVVPSGSGKKLVQNGKQTRLGKSDRTYYNNSSDSENEVSEADFDKLLVKKIVKKKKSKQKGVHSYDNIDISKLKNSEVYDNEHNVGSSISDKDGKESSSFPPPSEKVDKSTCLEAKEANREGKKFAQKMKHSSEVINNSHSDKLKSEQIPFFCIDKEKTAVTQENFKVVENLGQSDQNGNSDDEDSFNFNIENFSDESKIDSGVETSTSKLTENNVSQNNTLKNDESDTNMLKKVVSPKLKNNSDKTISDKLQKNKNYSLSSPLKGPFKLSPRRSEPNITKGSSLDKSPEVTRKSPRVNRSPGMASLKLPPKIVREVGDTSGMDSSNIRSDWSEAVNTVQSDINESVLNIRTSPRKVNSSPMKEGSPKKSENAHSSANIKSSPRNVKLSPSKEENSKTFPETRSSKMKSPLQKVQASPAEQESPTKSLKLTSPRKKNSTFSLKSPVKSDIASPQEKSSQKTTFEERDGPCLFSSDDEDATSLDVPLTPQKPTNEMDSEQTSDHHPNGTTGSPMIRRSMCKTIEKITDAYSRVDVTDLLLRKSPRTPTVNKKTCVCCDDISSGICMNKLSTERDIRKSPYGVHKEIYDKLENSINVTPTRRKLNKSLQKTTQESILSPPMSKRKRTVSRGSDVSQGVTTVSEGGTRYNLRVRESANTIKANSVDVPTLSDTDKINKFMSSQESVDQPAEELTTAWGKMQTDFKKMTSVAEEVFGLSKFAKTYTTPTKSKLASTGKGNKGGKKSDAVDYVKAMDEYKRMHQSPPSRKSTPLRSNESQKKKIQTENSNRKRGKSLSYEDNDLEDPSNDSKSARRKSTGSRSDVKRRSASLPVKQTKTTPSKEKIKTPRKTLSDSNKKSLQESGKQIKTTPSKDNRKSRSDSNKKSLFESAKKKSKSTSEDTNDDFVLNKKQTPRKKDKDDNRNENNSSKEKEVSVQSTRSTKRKSKGGSDTIRADTPTSRRGGVVNKVENTEATAIESSLNEDNAVVTRTLRKRCNSLSGHSTVVEATPKRNKTTPFKAASDTKLVKQSNRRKEKVPYKGNMRSKGVMFDLPEQQEESILPKLHTISQTDIADWFKDPSKRPCSTTWTKFSTEMFYQSVQQNGTGNWKYISVNENFNKTNVQLRDRWSSMLKNKKLMAMLHDKYGPVQ